MLLLMAISTFGLQRRC